MQLNETQVKLLRGLFGYTENGVVHPANASVFIQANTSRRAAKFAEVLAKAGVVRLEKIASLDGNAIFVRPVAQGLPPRAWVNDTESLTDAADSSPEDGGASVDEAAPAAE